MCHWTAGSDGERKARRNEYREEETKRSARFLESRLSITTHCDSGYIHAGSSVSNIPEKEREETYKIQAPGLSALKAILTAPPAGTMIVSLDIGFGLS